MNKNTIITSNIHNIAILRFFEYWFISNSLIMITAIGTSLILQNKILIYTIIGIFISYVAIIFARSLWYQFINSDSKKTILKIFWLSLLIRLLAVPLLALVFTVNTGVPFESGATKDDFVYNETSITLANMWRDGEWTLPDDLRFAHGNYSGYPIFTAFIMYLTFPSFWVARIANAILGACVVVLLYKIASICFTKRKFALLTGLIALTSPILIYYSATQHKDTLLLFLALLAILELIKILNNYCKIKSLFIIFFCLTTLLYVRSALAVIIIIVALIAFMRKFNFSSFLFKTTIPKNWIRGFLSLIIILISFLIIWQIIGNISSISSPTDYYESRFTGARLKGHERSYIGGSSYAKYLEYPLYAVGTPFIPTSLVVELPLDTVGDAVFRPTYYHIGYTLAIMALTPFLVMGILTWFNDRKMWTLHFIPIGIYLLYKLILANSYTILSGRLSLPAIVMSYLIIPLSIMSLKQNRKTLIFILIIFIQIFVFFIFNYIRLDIRGLI